MAARPESAPETENLAKFPSENPNPVLRLNEEGTVLYANEASAGVLTAWGCTVGGASPPAWRDLAREALASGESRTVDLKCDEIIYQMSVVPVGAQRYVNLYGMDITGHRRAEETLHASEARFRGIFENSPISLWEEDFSAAKNWLKALRESGVADFHEYFAVHPEAVRECAALVRILDVNTVTMRMMGANRKEEILGPLAELLGDTPSEEFVNELIAVAEGRTQFDSELANRTLDGRLIRVAFSWSVAPGFESSMSRVIVSMIDVTESRRAQAERQALSDIVQAAALTDNLNEFLERVRQSLARVLDAANLFVVFHNSHTGLFEEVFAVDKYDGPMPPSRLERSITSYVFRTGEPLLLSEAKFEELRASGEMELVGTQGASWLGAPLKTPARTIGVIAVQNYEDPNCYSERDRTFLASVAAEVALMIERKRAEANLEKQLQRLSGLRAIDAAISSSLDMRVSFNILLAQAVIQLQVDAAAVLVFNQMSNELEYVAGAGFRGPGITGLRLKLGEGYAGTAVLERRMAIVPNLAEAGSRFARPDLIAEEKFISFFAVPLVAKGQVKGVLEIFHRSRLDADQEWLNFLETLAEQAAIAIDSAQVFSELQRSNIELALAYDTTIEGWSRAMDLRDKETEGHTKRVTEASVKLGRLLGLSEQELMHLRRGALLHDIGKMGVSDAILLKPGALTEEEWVQMKQHPSFAYQMLSQVRYLQPAISVPYCHHERWDGTGYPRGLKGEQIPLAARIFAVIDVYDALTSNRPYRPGWTPEEAQQYVRSESGTQFDPRVVEAFVMMIAME